MSFLVKERLRCGGASCRFGVGRAMGVQLEGPTRVQGSSWKAGAPNAKPLKRNSKPTACRFGALPNSTYHFRIYIFTISHYSHLPLVQIVARIEGVHSVHFQIIFPVRLTPAHLFLFVDENICT